MLVELVPDPRPRRRRRLLRRLPLGLAEELACEPPCGPATEKKVIGPSADASAGAIPEMPALRRLRRLRRRLRLPLPLAAS